MTKTKNLLCFTSVAFLSVWLCAPEARALGIAPTILNYTATNGVGNPAAQTFVVTNEGLIAFNFTNTVSYSAGSGTNTWFTPSVMTGSVSAAGSLTVTGSVNITNLNEGTHYATNTFTAAAATNSPQTLVVTLRVLNPARLWVSPTNFQKVATKGQVLVGDVFQVANTGAAPRGTMTYTVTTNNTWLSVSPTNGNAQNDTNTVNLGYLTTNLSAGWYTGQVSVVAQGEGVGTQAVAVILRVNHRPGVAWDAGSKVWTNEVVAGDNLAAMTVAVWNASGEPAGQMNYTVSIINDAFGWVSNVSPASGVSMGNSQAAAVSYKTAGLAAGVYTAQLKVEGVDAATGEATTNGPLYMGLQLTVKGTPILKTDVTSLSQTVLENQTGTNSFLVWNGGTLPRGSMRYTTTTDVSWVSIVPVTGGVVTNEAMTNQVLWNTGVLSSGIYSGNLVVDAFDAQTSVRAAGAPLTIPLILTVTSRTPLNWELPAVVGAMYIGQMVDANVGLWRNQARLTFGYQWERASNKAGGGREVLSGATGSNYVITVADRGKYLRVDITATDSEPYALTTTTNSAWVDAAKVKALRADFNGDGITDLWFYDEASGTWHASFGSTNSAEGIFPGGPGMMAVPGDYDGDGYEDIGVYERAHGMWHICYLPRSDYVYGSLFGGTAEEAAATPVAADYDGDGATDVGLYYMGYWAIRYSSIGSVSVVEPFADARGTPVTGDWDGDGITGMGVYDDGVWTIRMESGSVVEQAFGGGGSGVLPAPADYDADGATDLGVYDVGANQWRWRESRTGFETNVNFGNGGLVPMPGHYDHDRSNDWAQAHMSADNDFIVWEVKRTTETNFPYRGQSYQQSTDRWRVSW